MESHEIQVLALFRCNSNHPRNRVNPSSMKAINRDRDDDKEIHDVVVMSNKIHKSEKGMSISISISVGGG